MGKRIQVETEVPFGTRLAELRRAASFTQVELAAELGISQRMVAYYENPLATPPAHLLPQIASALGLSIDTLYGRSAKRCWSSKMATAGCAGGCSPSRSSTGPRSAKCFSSSTPSSSAGS